jgi:hypothetical protein
MAESVRQRRVAGNRAIAWTREEDILALNLFVNGGVVNGGQFLSESHPLVVALSETLRALSTHPGVPREDHFRNPSGVAMKLMNLRAVERQVRLDRGMSGAEVLPAGMKAYSAMDRSIFEEYFDRDFLGLAEDAGLILAGGQDTGAAPLSPTAQDRPVEGAGTAAYETAGTEGGIRTRAEHDLVHRYATWAAGRGLEVVSRIYHEPGLARPFLCDLFLPARNTLIEAKSNDSRATIRMAIGQLLDYQHFEPSRPALAVLLPYQPAAEIKTLLAVVEISAISPHGDGFRESADENALAPDKKGSASGTAAAPPKARAPRSDM